MESTYEPFLRDGDTLIDRNLAPCFLSLGGVGDRVVELGLGEKRACENGFLGVW